MERRTIDVFDRAGGGEQQAEASARRDQDESTAALRQRLKHEELQHETATNGSKGPISSASQNDPVLLATTSPK